MLLLCYITKEGNYYLDEIKEEIKLTNISIKYNFFIQPQNFAAAFKVSGFGYYASYVYPKVLDFNLGDTLTIEYFIYNSYGAAMKIQIGTNSDYLKCSQINMAIKRCTVQKSNFKIKKSAYYYSRYQSRNMFLGTFYELPLIKVIIPPNKIVMNITKENNTIPIKVGQKGSFIFLTDYDDTKNNFFKFDQKLLEEKSKFNSTIYDENSNEYEVNCRLWKADENILRIICKLNENLKIDKQRYTLKKVSFNFSLDDIEINNVIINQENSIEIEQLNYNAPFLYSKSYTQEIDDQSNDDWNEMFSFNIESYNNETLFLISKGFNIIILNDCQINKKELICNVKKGDFLERFSTNYEMLSLGYNNFVNEPKIFDYVSQISTNFYNFWKTKIYVGILKLLEVTIEKNNYIAYETNVTRINRTISEMFALTNTFKSCFFRKYSQKPLLILCSIKDEGTYSLGEIKQEIYLDNINVRYNFSIQPVVNNEEFEVKDDGTYGLYYYPTILNFSLYDEIDVNFFIYSSKLIKGIKLNIDSDELNCQDINENTTKCFVHKSHFENKESGYYYIYHLNHKNNYSIFYEMPPIKVILPEENNKLIINIKKEDNKNIVIGYQGIFAFITDYNDNETNIFDIIDIEEKAKFNTFIIDNNRNKYNVSCRLWKPIDEKIRVICSLNENLKNNNQDILLVKFSFDYNNYHIILIQDDYIITEQYDYNISFLYSDKQLIKINDEEDTYNLTFKVESYYNDTLFIYGQKNNYAILDNCIINNNKELDCQITKEIIEGILIHNNEEFKIGAMNNNRGVIKFNSINDIIINYEISQKEEPYYR